MLKLRRVSGYHLAKVWKFLVTFPVSEGSYFSSSCNTAVGGSAYFYSKTLLVTVIIVVSEWKAFSGFEWMACVKMAKACDDFYWQNQIPWRYPKDPLSRWCCKIMTFRVFQTIKICYVMLQGWEKMFLRLKLEFTSQLNPLPPPCNDQTILLFDLPHLSVCQRALDERNICREVY